MRFSPLRPDGKEIPRVDRTARRREQWITPSAMTRVFAQDRERLRGAAAALLFFCLILLPGCEAENPAYPSAPRSGILNVYNDSFIEFSVFQFRPVGTDEWSKNYVTYPIEPDDDWYFFLPIGTFDLRFESSDGSETWLYVREIVENETVLLILEE